MKDIAVDHIIEKEKLVQSQGESSNTYSISTLTFHFIHSRGYPSSYGSHYASHGYYPPDISPGYRDRHHLHIPTDYYPEYSRSREYDRRPPT